MYQLKIKTYRDRQNVQYKFYIEPKVLILCKFSAVYASCVKKLSKTFTRPKFTKNAVNDK